MDMKACCTCATLLSATPRFSFSSTSSSEKPLPDDRLLPCCARVICGSCIYKNHRFRFYCPYCQISSSSSSSSSSPRPSLLPQGLKDPPSYSSVLAGSTNHPSSGTVTTLRRANRLGSDHLLLARRTVLIPARYYKAGVSLSPRPVEGEEEARKAKIRRWMVATKVADYDVAVLYLEQAGYDMAKATEAYFADEQWERENPIDHHDRDSRLKGKGKGKGWRRHLPGVPTLDISKENTS
ncbi:hypothetical protein B0T17DRAFT_608599 [Bombardia bombarda]|uniref:Uncharacterized protein n=1 Tax=Bombardia bombarda TaxID=252184 RepID=A0AA39WTL3_9PEZI|nr:hypothetical protein B0T17DRAFT_608599 [Bombardia bombarda]